MVIFVPKNSSVTPLLTCIAKQHDSLSIIKESFLFDKLETLVTFLRGISD
jgi:hypothetical protein